MNALKKSVALKTLRGRCSSIEFPQEAEVVIRLLESVLSQSRDFHSLSAPEVNLFKTAAIVRSPEFSIDLINPKIIRKEERVNSLDERCRSFAEDYVTCFRYNKITLVNGFNEDTIELSGYSALLVQHEVDHLNGILYYDRAISLALVRENGMLKTSDYCPCGSKKRLKECCDNERK